MVFSFLREGGGVVTEKQVKCKRGGKGRNEVYGHLQRQKRIQELRQSLFCLRLIKAAGGGHSCFLITSSQIPMSQARSSRVHEF